MSALGRPYHWVQAICGLDFVNDITSEQSADLKVQAALSASHIEDAICRVRARVEARLALLKQLASLGKCIAPIIIRKIL